MGRARKGANGAGAGALYTPPAQLGQAPSGLGEAAAAAAAGGTGGSGGGVRSPRNGGSGSPTSHGGHPPKPPLHAQRRRSAARRDPAEPKQNKTPFNFFSISARARAKAEHPAADQKVLMLHGMLHATVLTTAMPPGVRTVDASAKPWRSLPYTPGSGSLQRTAV